MKLKKIILLLLTSVLALSFFNPVKAASQELYGYIYSETAGWISLSCANTNSCNAISYNVSEDSSNKLSGYGYSQNGEWVNFNPISGGVDVNSDGTLSGWIYGQTSEWVNLNSEKVISLSDLQNEITSAKDITNNDSLSDTGTMSLLDSLCGQFLTSSECNLINNQ